MAYHFKLQALLSFRQNLEERAHQKLVREEAVLASHRQRLEELKAERQRLTERFEEQKRQRLAAALFSFYMEAIGWQEQQIKIQQATLASQRQVIEQARQELAEKVKARKVIEKVREKDFAAYLLELQRQEQNENDEQAILRFNRQSIF